MDKTLQASIIEFLTDYGIYFEILDISRTQKINAYLQNFWQGSTDKINWKKIDNPYLIQTFDTEISKHDMNELLIHSTFKILKYDHLVWYYSGVNPPILVDSKLLKSHLYELMETFIFLNTILFFDSLQLKEKNSQIDFMEVRIFDYLAGHI